MTAKAQVAPGGTRRESRIRIVNEPTATGNGGRMECDEDDAWFPLHKAIFTGNGVRLRQLIEGGLHDINLADVHGNTPLHLAVMLGNKANKATVRVKNNGGWSPLLEAVSYGDRPTVSALLRASKEEAHELLTTRKPYLYEMLNRLADFYLEVKWDFHTWIPLLSRILPSDTCKIYKRGCSLRMDTTLVDFTDRGVWERGDVSFIYNPHCSPTASPAKIAAAAAGANNGAIGHLVVLDNQRGVYQRVRRSYKPTELEEDVDMLMSNDIVTVQISTKPVQFVRAMSGWIFKQEKKADIGGLNADYYMVEGLRLVTRKRREHLTSDDIRRNKAFVQEFASGRALRRTRASGDPDGEDRDNATLLSDSDDGTMNGALDEEPSEPAESDDNRHRRSLPAPRRPTLSWFDYVNSPDSPPQLGRPHVEKSQTKEFKAVVAMSEEFALPVGVLVDILEIVSTSKHIEKLRDFCSGRLPPGFPVKLEIPLLPTISAHVTFQRFEWRSDLTPRHFEIPKEYVEDAKRFHSL